MTTTWRVLDRIDQEHLPRVRTARAAAREAAWAAGAGPDLAPGLCLDFDATISIAHSEKENAAATWKRTFGFHPLLWFLDRPDIAGGEALTGVLRAGNAGSNTAADHVTALKMALAALPEQAQPVPGDAGSPRVLARSDSAGASHTFAEACVAEGLEFSFGYPVDARVQRIVDVIPEECWHPAIETDTGDGSDIREGAWVAEATGTIDLDSWPEGPRLILRKERPPHPGRAADLHRHRRDPRHRTADQHPRRDRARAGRRARAAPPPTRPRPRTASAKPKATGLRNFSCHAMNENNAWLEVVLTAVDLITWTKTTAFAHVPELARCEIAAFRYRVLHVAARLTRSARQTRLRIDKTWRWATHIAEGFTQVRAAFP